MPREEVRVLVFLALVFSLSAVLVLFVARCENDVPDTDCSVSDSDRQLADQLCEQMHRKALEADTLCVSLFPFDPNRADSVTLRRLGFREQQVRNLLKYREKGGRWHSVEDLKKLYGLTETEFERLRPYVRIATEDLPQPHEAYSTARYPMPKGERPNYERQEKYAMGTVISLNRADTFQLKHIPGIGSHYARRIVDYRERLGGYVSVHQLSEIEGLPSGIEQWFTIEPHSVPKRIHLNKADFKQLVRHPYLTYEQTKSICNHIRSYGPIRTWRDLSLYPEFGEADFERLTPYVDFD